MTMTKTKRIISLALVLVTLLSVFSIFTLNASAKWISAKKNFLYTVYHGMEKYTFTVKTSGEWWQGDASIKFHSSASNQDWNAKAPTLVLRVWDYSTGTLTIKYITGSGNDYYSTLYLKKNRTYDISVCYLDNWETNKTPDVGVGNVYKWADGYWEITSSTRVNFQ